MKKGLFILGILLGFGQMFGQLMIDDILITDPSCSDSCNGEIVIIASGGIPPMEYSIDNGQTFQTSNSFTGLCAGMYDAVAQDFGGEQFHQPVDLIATPIGALFTIDDAISCQGDTDGVLTVDAYGGFGGYTYLWVSDQTTDVTNYSGHVGYNVVVVTDWNGCSDSMQVYLDEPTLLEVSVSSVNTTCSYATGSSVASLFGGTTPYGYSWASGGAGLTETNLTEGDYVFTVTDANGCIATETANIGMDVFPVDVCVVTVDSTSTKNVVVWEKPIVNGISHFNIYRDVVGTYTYVDSIPYDSLSQYEDVTGGVNPQVTQYRYKISVVDSCGNESDLSAFHQTIHLNAPNLVGNTADLVWQGYGGFTSNFYYRILRDSTGTNDWEVVDSVSLTTLVYTDIAVPNTSNISYLVQIATPNTCTATKAQDHNSTRSNRASIAAPNAINKNALELIKVNPNPTTGKFNINLGGGHSETIIELFDLQGKLITTKMVNTASTEFDLSDNEKGLYLIKVSSERGVQTIRVVKQ